MTFYHLRPTITYDFFKVLYFAWIDSIINYAILCWGADYTVNISIIDKILKKIYRIILTTKRPNDKNDFFYYNIRKLYIFKCIIFIKKNPNYFKRKAKVLNTRENDIFQIPFEYKEINRKYFSYAGPKIANLLSSNIWSIPSIYATKKRARSYLNTIPNVNDIFDFLK